MNIKLICQNYQLGIFNEKELQWIIITSLYIYCTTCTVRHCTYVYCTACIVRHCTYSSLYVLYVTVHILYCLYCRSLYICCTTCTVHQCTYAVLNVMYVTIYILYCFTYICCATCTVHHWTYTVEIVLYTCCENSLPVVHPTRTERDDYEHTTHTEMAVPTQTHVCYERRHHQGAIQGFSERHSTEEVCSLVAKPPCIRWTVCMHVTTGSSGGSM